MYTLYAERDLQHKEGEVHILCRVDNDRHPCTPVAIRGEGIQEAGNNSIRYYPQLVNVIETEEYTVRHPTPASEHTFHPGQEHSPKEELLGQDLGGHGEYHDEAVALGLSEKREDRHPSAFYRRIQYELHHPNRYEERYHPQP